LGAAKPKITRKTVLLPIVGLAAFFLYILIFNVDFLEIINTAKTANPIIYIAAIAVSLVEVFFYAVSWQRILKYLKVKLSILKSYLFVWYGNFIDIIIPAESISGEVCRVYLVNREQEGTSGKVVASVVIQRLIGMGMNVVFLIAGIVLLYLEAQVNPLIFNLILFFAAAIVAIMVLLLLISVKESWSKKIINAIVRVGEFITRGRWKKLRQIEEEALRNTALFHDSVKEFIRKPQALIIPTLAMAVNWLCSLSVSYLVFLSLGFEIPWSVIFITGSIVVAVKSIPIGIPFEVGLPEITMTTLYTSMLGMQYAPICATATILSRIITLWLRFAIGFASQQWIELRSTLNQQKTPPLEKT
jgi:uncharacterized protein (TIRG00374 family)